MRALAAFAIALFLGLAGPDAVAQQDGRSVVGTWQPPERDSAFEIYPCGDRFCGRITMINEPNTPDGKPKADLNNEDPTQRGRPLLGMEFLSGFRHEGGGSYQEGRIYNPRDGKLYKANMKLEDSNNTLRVRGYVGVPMLGQTQVWTRLR